jgi:hypothetical protein
LLWCTPVTDPVDDSAIRKILIPSSPQNYLY